MTIIRGDVIDSLPILGLIKDIPSRVAMTVSS